MGGRTPVRPLFNYMPMEEFGKLYYKISEVSDLLGVPASTLRYWEQEFDGIRPKRSTSNQRYYRPDDLRKLQMINYLVRTKGLRIEAAKQEFLNNSSNISKRLDVIDLLTDTRDELKRMLDALTKRK